MTIRTPKEDVPKKKRKIKNRTAESKQRSVEALKKARIEASKVLKKKAASDLAATTKLTEYFLSRLQKKTKRTFVASRDVAEIGDLFVVDRIETSRYITVYCEALKSGSKPGKDVTYRKPVVSVVMAVRTHSISFRMPLDVDDFRKVISEPDSVKVGLEEFDEGRFKSKTAPMDREGAAIVADAIASAVRKGIIGLPSVGV